MSPSFMGDVNHFLGKESFSLTTITLSELELSAINSEIDKIKEQVQQVVIGLDKALDMLIIAVLSGGHVLLEGYPGLGKTTLAKTFAESIGGEFKRIQMTPDMLPADILGLNVYNPLDGTWTQRLGPIFGNVVMLDELNRASPKVQSAFLESMQENQVTLEGQTIPLKKPFIVIATQVPYGEPGTYPLTSVQADRFAFIVSMDYPEWEVERRVIENIHSIESTEVEPVLSLERLLELADRSKTVFVHERVSSYIVDLVNLLRSNRYLRSGPSPRASIWLLKGSQVRALMMGRNFVVPDDVKFLAEPVLAHRINLTPQARAEGVERRQLINEALNTVPVPKGEG